MRTFILMDFIHIGNVGIEEDYLYIFCGLASIIIISYAAKPMVEWAIRFKLRKFLSYLISSIFAILAILSISFFAENMSQLVVMKITLQSMSVYGILYSVGILIQRFIRKTN
ncbi:hypothetical protein [Oceanobacillus sp. CF4.6]|uniref:hypothetical protein n=1 Tax=Oceanobacillus sp. CF4.6 TaxID=3373080 RepID=UPI003EE7788F